MIERTYISARERVIARATFTLPGGVWADKIHLDQACAYRRTLDEESA